MSTPAIAPRTERIEARVSPDHKRLFEQAARMSGLTLTEFLVITLQDAANRVIQERRLMKLTARDCEVFVDALLNPPAPGKRLRLAARRYRARQTA